MNRSITMFVLVAGFVLFSRAVSAQAPPHSESDELVDLNWQTPMWQPQLDGTLGWLPPRPAVAGYEQEMRDYAFAAVKMSRDTMDRAVSNRGAGFTIMKGVMRTMNSIPTVKNKIMSRMGDE